MNRSVDGGPAARAIGVAIRALRRERNITMEALAERADISYQYLSEIERGRCNFSVAVLQGLATALGVPMADIVARAGLDDSRR